MTPSRRVLEVVERSSPPDAALLREKVDVSTRYVENWERQVRATATWPWLLLVGTACAATVFASIAAPVLRASVLSREPVSLVPVWLAVGVSFVGVGLITAASFGWVSLPALGAFRVVRDAYFSLLLADSVEAGVALPVALRVCGAVCGGDASVSGAALARALEAGAATPPEVRVPDAVEARMLFMSARSGTLLASAHALRALARARLERTAPRMMNLMRLSGLALAGLSLLACAATFYQTYVHALVG